MNTRRRGSIEPFFDSMHAGSFVTNGIPYIFEFGEFQLSLTSFLRLFVPFYLTMKVQLTQFKRIHRRGDVWFDLRVHSVRIVYSFKSILVTASVIGMRKTWQIQPERTYPDWSFISWVAIPIQKRGPDMRLQIQNPTGKS